MTFENKTLTCTDCSATFTFSVEDQEFFQSKGYTNDPKRCPQCREARKTDRSGGSSQYGGERQMFTTTCSECGKTAEVPFVPRGDRPVYCHDCFRKVSPRR